MQFKNDQYDHSRLPKSEITKQRMSEAKRGRKYTPEHRLNMKVSQILKNCIKNNVDPIDHVTDHKTYTTLEKREIIKNIIRREDERNERL